MNSFMYHRGSDTDYHNGMRPFIFVFGSNLSGYHGGGAAVTAVEKYKAVMGRGIGREGNSYAIPTKDHEVNTLPLYVINFFIAQFLDYAIDCPKENFFVTRIGCGLAGYKDKHMAPLFKNASDNCIFDEKWRPFLEG
jgi:hypothetical protein